MPVARSGTLWLGRGTYGTKTSANLVSTNALKLSENSGRALAGNSVIIITGKCVTMHRMSTNLYTFLAAPRYAPAVIDRGLLILLETGWVRKYLIIQCATTVHKGNACQKAIYLWCATGETISGDDMLIRIEGMIYPSVIDDGRILRSSVGIRITLAADLPGKSWAIGEVRRCKVRYSGTVIVKAMFWMIIPVVPMLYVCQIVIKFQMNMALAN